MNLPHPVTITTPSQQQITLTSLDIGTIDIPSRQVVRVQIRPFPMPLIAWEGEAYVAAGDWTQAQLEARVVELLGENPAAVLEGLWPKA